MNDRVLKIAGGIELVNKAGIPHAMVSQSSLADIILVLQNEFLKDPMFQRNNPIMAAALAWILNSKSKANAALFVPNAKKVKLPKQIGYRLANTNLALLGTLNSLQEQGKLTTHVINENVWSKLHA